MKRALIGWLFRALRLSLLLSLLCGGGGLLVVQRARAYSERMLVSLGDHMMRYAGAENQHKPVELRINGASLYMSNGAVDAPVSEVLDHFHAACVRKNGQIGAQWAEAVKQSGRTVSGHSALTDGVLRMESEGAGTIACFETGDDRLSLSALVDRARAFFATGDASKLGKLRYVHVTRGKRRSVFVAIWSEGPLPLFEMFPKTGDAPGADPAGVDRPKDTRRLLSTQQIGRDELVSMYQAAHEGPRELATFYRRTLRARGYRLLAGDAEHPDFIVAHDGKHMLSVALGADEDGHGIATLTTRPD